MTLGRSEVRVTLPEAYKKRIIAFTRRHGYIPNVSGPIRLVKCDQAEIRKSLDEGTDDFAMILSNVIHSLQYPEAEQIDAALAGTDYTYYNPSNRKVTIPAEQNKKLVQKIVHERAVGEELYAEYMAFCDVAEAADDEERRKRWKPIIAGVVRRRKLPEPS